MLNVVGKDARDYILASRKSKLEELFKDYVSVQTQLGTLDASKYSADYNFVDIQYNTTEE